MKKTILKAVILSLTMGASLPILAQEGTYNDTLKLSLDQCITIALSENPSIKVADMEIKRMDYSKKEVIGQLLPSISFAGQYSRTVEKQTMYLNMSALTGGAGTGSSSTEGGENSETAASASKSSSASGIKMGLDNSYSLGFSASMPIIAPQLWKSLNLSDTQILQSVETRLVLL